MHSALFLLPPGMGLSSKCCLRTFRRRLLLLLALFALFARPLLAQQPPPAGEGDRHSDPNRDPAAPVSDAGSPPVHPESPSVHQELPPVQQQPPPVQQQPPPVQQQPPPVQQQPPPVHKQQPSDPEQQPPVHEQQPPVHDQQPPVHEQQPPVHHQQQSAQEQPQPIYHLDQPVHQQEQQVVHQQQQPAHNQMPAEPHESLDGVKRMPSVLLPSDPNEFDTRSISFVFLLPSRGKQCFYHRAAGNFTFEYQVTNGGSLDIDVFVNSPGGKLAFDRRGKAYGETSFAYDPDRQQQEQHLPAYMLCLDNRYSSWHDKLVYFSIDIEHGRDGKRPGAEQLSASLRANLKDLELSWEEFYKSTDKVEDHLLRTIYHLSKSRNNEARDRMLMEESNSRVSTWSLFQLAVMLFVAGIQVLMIRSLFDEKSKLHRVWKAAN